MKELLAKLANPSRKFIVFAFGGLGSGIVCLWLGAHYFLAPGPQGRITKYASSPTLGDIYKAEGLAPIGAKKAVQDSFVGTAIEWKAEVFDTPKEGGKTWLEISCPGQGGVAFIPLEQAGPEINRAKPNDPIVVRGTISGFTDSGCPVLGDTQIELMQAKQQQPPN